MVKEENANFSLPDSWAGPRSEPDVPPGFPPKTSTSAAVSQLPAAEDPSRNQNSASDNNGFRRVRTSRKRVRPQFYSPAPARGRPPKERLMFELSHLETEIRNSNQVSSTPLSRQVTLEQSSSQPNNQLGEQSSQLNISPSPYDRVGQTENMKGMNHCIAVDKNQASATQRSTFQTHDIEETLFDISRTEVPGRASGYETVGNAGLNDQTSQGIDPKILQHVANALQYMAGSQSAVDDTKVKARTSDSHTSLSHMLKAINKMHGDIVRDCTLESDCMRTLVLLGICKVVQDLQNKQLKDLDVTTLNSYYSTVRDAENMKLNVQWLHNRLDEIKDAVILTNEAKGLVDEKNRCLENIDSKKKELILRKVELERLKSEVQAIEGQLGQEVLMIEKLNKKIGAQLSKCSQFPFTYLMDGLI